MNHIPNPHHPSIDDTTHQQRSPFRSPYDPQNPQYASSSMDSHLSMAFIPLPIDTPLPASAFAMPPNGFNPPGHSPQQGPTGHPLYEGVVGMHYMLSQGMPWAEYNGYNSTRDTSQNEDDLFCQNPTPLVPLPIRPSTSRLSSQSSLQSWQSDCTETDSHPETSSSYKGTPPARPTPSATPTSPPQSTDTSITFQLDVRDYMRVIFVPSKSNRPLPRTLEPQPPLISPTRMLRASSERNSATENGIFSPHVSPKAVKAVKSPSPGAGA